MAFKNQLNTEQHTKEGFIMPFIKELGYDVFNPFEVIPELVADGGIKQDEKIDYAIMQNGEPIILIECKHHAAHLNVNKASQLFRYAHSTKENYPILLPYYGEYIFILMLSKPKRIFINLIMKLLKFSKIKINRNLFSNQKNLSVLILKICSEFAKPFAKQFHATASNARLINLILQKIC